MQAPDIEKRSINDFLFLFREKINTLLSFGAEKFGRTKIINFFQELIILFFDQTFCGEESFVDQNSFAVFSLEEVLH